MQYCSLGDVISAIIVVFNVSKWPDAESFVNWDSSVANSDIKFVESRERHANNKDENGNRLNTEAEEGRLA